VSVLRDIAAAFGWLSIVPVKAYAEARPTRWFPLVGWMFGGLAYGMARAAGLLGFGLFGMLLAAALIVAAWAVGSRFLHWDGAADSVDGLLGGATPERRLEIMHDSSTGAFGTTTIVLLASLQVFSVAALISSLDLWPLVAAPVLGRLSAVTGLWTVPRSSTTGLAARLPASEGWLAWAIAGVLIVPLALLSPLQSPMLLVGVIAAMLVPRALARPVGGISGDLLGASVLLVETLVLVASALLSGG
jgi:adenosylcobinamide-GDP ribazoletransferase